MRRGRLRRWVKRGPRGGIGSDRADAAELVAALVEAVTAGRTTVGRGSVRSFRALARSRRPGSGGRPRVAPVTVEGLLGTARR